MVAKGCYGRLIVTPNSMFGVGWEFEKKSFFWPISFDELLDIAWAVVWIKHTSELMG